MVTFADARDVLAKRLEAIFGSEAFGELYEVTAPKVYTGFPVNEPPFYVAVDEVVDTAETDGAVTMGHAKWDFTITVWAFAQHKEQKTVADTLLSYTDAIFKAVLADPQLNMTVDNSFPSIETAGTAADSSKRYMGAASVSVRCTVYSKCPAELIALVDAANQG